MNDETSSTYPPHDCKAWNTQCSHNQDDANYTTCGICGRITSFEWKERHEPKETK